MEDAFRIAAIWLSLAVVATALANHLRLSMALVEICVGIAAGFAIDRFFGAGALGANVDWLRFLAATWKAPSAAPLREAAAPPGRPPAAPLSAPAVVPASVAPVQQEPKAVSAVEASAAATEVNWEPFQESVSTNHPNIAPFLEMGRLVKIEGALITLGFAKQATTARSMLEKEDNLQALAALGESLYGCAVRIRIVEVAEQDPGAAPTMKQIRVAKEQEQRLILTQQAKAHPLVKQALEMFGGELAEVHTTAPAQEVQE